MNPGADTMQSQIVYCRQKGENKAHEGAKQDSDKDYGDWLRYWQNTTRSTTDTSNRSTGRLLLTGTHKLDTD